MLWLEAASSAAYRSASRTYIRGRIQVLIKWYILKVIVIYTYGLSKTNKSEENYIFWTGNTEL